MSMKKLLHEPLLHFMLLGALLFAAYAALARHAPPAPPARTAITVTQGRVHSIVAVFELTWQRAPTPDERVALIDDFIREEILYREGVALGLDRDDAWIRRRVRQKVELLAEEAQESPGASDAQLQAYLERHGARFQREARLSFRQAYLDPGRAPADLDREIARLLRRLPRAAADAAGNTGDATQLPHAVDDAALSEIDRDFGPGFAAALMQQPVGKWSGPVPSAFGVHVVFVAGLVPARAPALAQVRGAVEREWVRDRRAGATEAWYRLLRDRYTVSIEPARNAGLP